MKKPLLTLTLYCSFVPLSFLLDGRTSHQKRAGQNPGELDADAVGDDMARRLLLRIVLCSPLFTFFWAGCIRCFPPAISDQGQDGACTFPLFGLHRMQSL